MLDISGQVVDLLCLDLPSSYSAISGLPAWCQINPDTCFLSLRGARRDHPQNLIPKRGGGVGGGGGREGAAGSGASPPSPSPDRSGCRDANEVRWFQIKTPLYYRQRWRLAFTHPLRQSARIHVCWQLYAQFASRRCSAASLNGLGALLYKEKR